MYRPGANGRAGRVYVREMAVGSLYQWERKLQFQGTQPRSYNELDGWINTITNVAGVVVKRSASRKETATLILDLYRWWNEKTFESHRSHLGFDESSKPTLYKPSFLRRVAAEFPGIGWEKSGDVALRFGTLWNMVNADEKIWTSIKGVGKVLAKRAYDLIRNGETKEEKQ